MTDTTHLPGTITYKKTREERVAQAITKLLGDMDLANYSTVTHEPGAVTIKWADAEKS